MAQGPVTRDAYRKIIIIIKKNKPCIQNGHHTWKSSVGLARDFCLKQSSVSFLCLMDRSNIA